jgi:hypothetical protein
MLHALHTDAVCRMSDRVPCHYAACCVRMPRVRGDADARVQTAPMHARAAMRLSVLGSILTMRPPTVACCAVYVARGLAHVLP